MLQKVLCSLLCFLCLPALTGCIVMTGSAPRAMQISAPGVDAAEPATASAADGTFYVAWVNHDAKQADVMIARFAADGQMQGSPVRVNREPGVATAWRGDQPAGFRQKQSYE